ncbi:kyphoscoliosis peptidase [Polypterus senegalus]
MGSCGSSYVRRTVPISPTVSPPHFLGHANANNNNNTDFPEDTYSRGQPQRDQNTPEKCNKARDLSLSDVTNGNHVRQVSKRDSSSQVLGEIVVCKEWDLQGSLARSNDNGRCSWISSASKASLSDFRSKKNMFEFWEVAEQNKKNSNVEKPSTKRQLSNESTQNFRVVKKPTVRKDIPYTVEASTLSILPGERKTSMVGRKSRKDLFHDPKVFRRVDNHVLAASKQLKTEKVHSVQKITQCITQGAQSDLERVRAIWIWLCHNIEYDITGYLGLSEKLCSPEQVIEAGKGVCCGYSRLCLEMCRVLGIQCVEISGHGKGIGYQLGQNYQNTKSNHMWNAVQLGGQWFLLDACWGAGTVDIGTRTFTQRYDEFYFLPDPETFIDSHCPDDCQWQLTDSPISLEDFEQSVFKTSEFYRLGISLISPKSLHLLTVNGEAVISLGCSVPLEFTYQILQQSEHNPQDLSSSFGLLTVSRKGMNLKLLPPVGGIYDIMVFARPALSQGNFSWVCTFQVECQEPKPSEERPENPFLSWGLQQTAKDLGIKDCSHGIEPFTTESGTFELILHTMKPLMILCEFVHKDLDPSLAKRCVASQIEEEKITCHVLCPFHGYYRFSVFVKDFEGEGSYQNAGNFLIQCTGTTTNLNELFPPSLSPACGPGVKTRKAGISKPSHSGPIISTQQGKCNITFHIPQNVELTAVLAKEQMHNNKQTLNRYVLLTYTDSKITVSVSLPQAGIYRLGLFAKTSSIKDFSHVCDYVLKCSSEQPGTPFPSTFSAWKKGCVLFEPRSGTLEPHSWVRFRIRVPGAQKVCVVGETRTELQLNKSRVWEGEIFTGGASSELKLAAKFSSETSNLDVIMSFEVMGLQTEL